MRTSCDESRAGWVTRTETARRRDSQRVDAAYACPLADRPTVIARPICAFAIRAGGTGGLPDVPRAALRWNGLAGLFRGTPISPTPDGVPPSDGGVLEELYPRPICGLIFPGPPLLGYSNGFTVEAVANGVPRNVGCGCGAARGGIGMALGRAVIVVEDRALEAEEVSVRRKTSVSIGRSRQRPEKSVVDADGRHTATYLSCKVRGAMHAVAVC